LFVIKKLLSVIYSGLLIPILCPKVWI